MGLVLTWIPERPRLEVEMGAARHRGATDDAGNWLDDCAGGVDGAVVIMLVAALVAAMSYGRG